MPSEEEALLEALGPREVIGQAVGLLIAQHDDVDEDAAFEILVQGSADSDKKVREVAVTIFRQRSGE